MTKVLKIKGYKYSFNTKKNILMFGMGGIRDMRNKKNKKNHFSCNKSITTSSSLRNT